VLQRWLIRAGYSPSDDRTLAYSIVSGFQRFSTRRVQSKASSLLQHTSGMEVWEEWQDNPRFGCRASFAEQEFDGFFDRVVVLSNWQSTVSEP
jgi:hypothetical protein